MTAKIMMMGDSAASLELSAKIEHKMDSNILERSRGKEQAHVVLCRIAARASCKVVAIKVWHGRPLPGEDWLWSAKSSATDIDILKIWAVRRLPRPPSYFYTE